MAPKMYFFNKHLQKQNPNTRWWQLKYFLFSPLFGEDSHFHSYFSIGLKPPTRISSCQFSFYSVRHHQWFTGWHQKTLQTSLRSLQVSRIRRILPNVWRSWLLMRPQAVWFFEMSTSRKVVTTEEETSLRET